MALQVARDVDVDCSLAEASVRIQHLEARLAAQKHDEMMTNASHVIGINLFLFHSVHYRSHLISSPWTSLPL